MFQVDIDQMRALIINLRTAETAMREAMAAMHFTGGAENVGTKKLDEQCNTFQKHWKYGLDQIHKGVEETLQGLDLVLNVYQEVDQALADLYSAMAAS